MSRRIIRLAAKLVENGGFHTTLASPTVCFVGQNKHMWDQIDCGEKKHLYLLYIIEMMWVIEWPSSKVITPLVREARRGTIFT